MRCPNCRESLVRSERDGVPLFTCGNCFGAWIRQPALKRLTRLTPDPASPQEPASIVDLAALVTASNTRTRLYCPECTSALGKDRVHPLVRVDIDRCPKCRGAWVDAGELSLIRALYHELQTSSDPRIVRLREKLAVSLSDAAAQRLQKEWAFEGEATSSASPISRILERLLER